MIHPLTAWRISADFPMSCTDIVAGHALNLVEMVGFMDAEKYPKLAELLAKLKQRPAFAKIFSPKKEE